MAVARSSPTAVPRDGLGLGDLPAVEADSVPRALSGLVGEKAALGAGDGFAALLVAQLAAECDLAGALARAVGGLDSFGSV